MSIEEIKARRKIELAKLGPAKGLYKPTGIVTAEDQQRDAERKNVKNQRIQEAWDRGQENNRREEAFKNSWTNKFENNFVVPFGKAVIETGRAVGKYGKYVGLPSQVTMPISAAAEIAGYATGQGRSGGAIPRAWANWSNLWLLFLERMREYAANPLRNPDYEQDPIMIPVLDVMRQAIQDLKDNGVYSDAMLQSVNEETRERFDNGERYRYPGVEPPDAAVRTFSGGAKPSDEIYKAAAVAAYDKTVGQLPGGYRPVLSTPTLKAWVDPKDGELVVGVRGTYDATDMLANASLPLNKLESTSRYKRDEASLLKLVQRFPNKAVHFASHSLGAAIARRLENKVTTASSRAFNPAFEPAFMRDAGKQQRIYRGNDFLGKVGRYLPGAELRPAAATDQPADKVKWYDPRTWQGVQHHLMSGFGKTKKKKTRKAVPPRKMTLEDQNNEQYWSNGRQMILLWDLDKGKKEDIYKYYHDKVPKDVIGIAHYNRGILGAATDLRRLVGLPHEMVDAWKSVMRNHQPDNLVPSADYDLAKRIGGVRIWKTGKRKRAGAPAAAVAAAAAALASAKADDATTLAEGTRKYEGSQGRSRASSSYSDLPTVGKGRRVVLTRAAVKTVSGLKKFAKSTSQRSSFWNPSNLRANTAAQKQLARVKAGLEVSSTPRKGTMSDPARNFSVVSLVI